MLSRLLTNFIVTLIVTVLSHSIASGQVGDLGVPDTTYFEEPVYSISSCQPTVDHVIELLLYSDGTPYGIGFHLDWTFPAVLADLRLGSSFSGSGTTAYIQIDSLNNSISVVIDQGDYGAFDWGFPPKAKVLCSLRFRSQPGDSFSLSLRSPGVTLLGLDDYHPSVFQQIVECTSPDSITLSSGDANCSGDVTISDVVHLLQYIFQGGAAPYDMNAADPDSSCSVTVSDAVFLIQYVFQGGMPPQAGCVAP